MTYEVYVGEMFNVPRAISALAVATHRGIEAAVSGIPDFGMADAMAERAEQAAGIIQRAEGAVREREARERARAGKF